MYHGLYLCNCRFLVFGKKTIWDNLLTYILQNAQISLSVYCKTRKNLNVPRGWWRWRPLG